MGEVETDRRAFVLGALAVALPGPAAAGVRRVGFISSSTTSLDSPLLVALREGLRERGYEEGKNLAIDYRFAQSRDQLPAMAADLVARKVELILAAGSEGIVAARAATASIPIVMTNSGDAVREGFVASLDRPGGNITGLTQISPELVGKRLEILQEVVPDLKVVGILWNPMHPNTPISFQEATAATERLGLAPVSLELGDPGQIQPGLAKLAAAGARAFLVIRDPFTVRHRAIVVNALHRLRLVAIFETFDFFEAGGLMFYGADFADLFRRAAAYVDKILKGARPADLPVEQPTKFVLGINNRVAAQTGVAIPASLLARADHVIE
ncbi:MAG TPA: ABC transporter substrate-binding protein [Microvirga sp.]|nr:ABC transporter substrate-binding protein [Microvirga sp.]